jgi:hypothetical protein
MSSTEMRVPAMTGLPQRTLGSQRMYFCQSIETGRRVLSPLGDRGMRPLHLLSIALQLSTAGFKALSLSGEKRLSARWRVSDLCCLSLLAWAVGWSGATRHHSHPAPCRVRRQATQLPKVGRRLLGRKLSAYQRKGKPLALADGR